MSKYSVICEWYVCEDNVGGSLYGFCGENLHLMLIHKNRIESINTIVHEINECEVFNLLRTKFLTDIGGDYHKIYIRANKKLKKKYPWIFSTVGNIEVTHIISPYGIKNCIISRQSSHLSWGKKGK